MVTNFEFKKQILDIHIEKNWVKYCYQCNRCTDNCPVSNVSKNFYTRSYDPRLNILNTLLGYKNAIFDKEDGLAIWGCTICDTCDEVCPQNIELTEIFTFLKNESVKIGKAPQSIYAQAKAVYDFAKAIPPQPAIERRREKLNLPPVLSPNISEIQSLLKNIGVDKYLK